jgi:hypothetical protein
MNSSRSLVLAVTGLVCLASYPAHAQSENSRAHGSEDVVALMDQFPHGGDRLTDAVARLVVTHPELAPAFIKTRGSATTEVSSATAAGLAQSAVILKAIDPSESKRIRDAVSQDGDRRFTTQFSIAYASTLDRNGADHALKHPERPEGRVERVNNEGDPDANHRGGFNNDRRPDRDDRRGSDPDRGNPFHHHPPVSPN